MKRYYLLIFSAVIILVNAINLHAAVPSDICFECHDRDLLKGSVVHQPVQKGNCVECHNPHAGKYQGMISYEQGRLCFTCHIAEKESFQKGIVHEPISRFECTACHEPHASDAKGLVKTNLKESCLACHEAFPERFRFTHVPYELGNCDTCHRPHNADIPMLLIAEGVNLCTSCHDRGSLQEKHTIDVTGSIGSCLTCHNPHGSDRKGLIRNFLHEPYAEGCSSCHEGNNKDVGMTKCAECHEDVIDQMQATHSHFTQRTGNSCVNCHSPHAGDEKRLLLAREKQVCAKCHRASIEKYRKSPNKHGSIDQCTDCHFPHGGNDMALLKGNGLEVCALCHEDQGKFTHPVGEDVPDPRTGRMVTCITCHNPMGTEYSFNLILDGKRKLCVQCHGEY